MTGRPAVGNDEGIQEGIQVLHDRADVIVAEMMECNRLLAGRKGFIDGVWAAWPEYNTWRDDTVQRKILLEQQLKIIRADIRHRRAAIEQERFRMKERPRRVPDNATPETMLVLAASVLDKIARTIDWLDEDEQRAIDAIRDYAAELMVPTR